MSAQTVQPQIESSWKAILQNEFQQPYFATLKAFLIEEKSKHKVYPPGSEIFAAFNHTPFDQVKVVIIGQDPYHGAGQAHGMCFSVRKGVTPPPSLKNIYKEIQDDIGGDIPTHGELTQWADQGVLLLNATLTVRAGQAGSHQNKGWEQFTDAVIGQVSQQKSGVVFLLWGNFAKQKAALIDAGKHHILTCPHPSPFAARYGFFGSKHFSKTNALLQQGGKEPIDWIIK